MNPFDGQDSSKHLSIHPSIARIERVPVRDLFDLMIHIGCRMLQQLEYRFCFFATIDGRGDLLRREGLSLLFSQERKDSRL